MKTTQSDFVKEYANKETIETIESWTNSKFPIAIKHPWPTHHKNLIEF